MGRGIIVAAILWGFVIIAKAGEGERPGTADKAPAGDAGSVAHGNDLTGDAGSDAHGNALAGSGADGEDAVEGQPLGANVIRLIEALELIGHPLPGKTRDLLRAAARNRDSQALQRILDPHALVVVSINPEQRVKVSRGPAAALLSQNGHTPVIVKVLNEATATARLRISSPQAGAVYAGASRFSLQRQQQTELATGEGGAAAPGRFLDVAMFESPPLTGELSGLEVEYRLALIYSAEAGRREATLAFDIGQGTQDLGFRGETPVLFDVRPAVPVKLSIHEADGTPTMARLTFRNAQGHVWPPQPLRLAPDFFFQPHIYRADGETLLLPAGTFSVAACRGPEYVERTQEIAVTESGPQTIEIRLQRWIDPQQFGFYCGDHHIHGAGCAHYTSPTEGVAPRDMFRQVKGEGLNVGCVLTWGPCYDYQRQYFSPLADAVSEPLTRLKYDLEISGFGSQALGHVCLLNLREQTYPGSEGTSVKGWPTWTVPVLKWAKEQGGVTGYPHSDMRVDPPGAAKWIVERNDANKNGSLDAAEAAGALLPQPFARIDHDEDRRLTTNELEESCDRAANELPNVVLPAMTGAGAMEIFVAVPEGVCDFNSAMDTGRIGEWNTWYHLMNCGYPLKLSGETDFPCMSSRRVGQGRAYVQLAGPSADPLPPLDEVDFAAWCEGIARGRSYVSDGYAHAVRFTVNGAAPGFDDVRLDRAGEVDVAAVVAFAPELPRAVSYGTEDPPEGRRDVGDTRVLHAPRNSDSVRGGERLVELVVNGSMAAQQAVPADGRLHAVQFRVPVAQSSWIAVRQFPQLHTNPVTVLVADKPVRASRESARWCEEAVALLWQIRSRLIAADEREAARAAYDRAAAAYRRIADESSDTSR